MVPLPSLQIPRVCRYSGYRPPSHRFAYEILTLSDWLSHTIRLRFNVLLSVLTPKAFLSLVWPLPISLATTFGISFDFSSSPYLDVSVQAVPFITLFVSCNDTWAFPMWVSPFGNLRIYAHLQLPVAYRSLSRPSSAPIAKAFPLRSF